MSRENDDSIIISTRMSRMVLICRQVLPVMAMIAMLAVFLAILVMFMEDRIAAAGYKPPTWGEVPLTSCPGADHVLSGNNITCYGRTVTSASVTICECSNVTNVCNNVGGIWHCDYGVEDTW